MVLIKAEQTLARAPPGPDSLETNKTWFPQFRWGFAGARGGAKGFGAARMELKIDREAVSDPLPPARPSHALRLRGPCLASSEFSRECFRTVKTGGEGRARGQRSGRKPGPRAETPPESPLTP